MPSERANLLAIAGGTCSGKSTLANELWQTFTQDSQVVTQDDYYPDRSAWSAQKLNGYNWDTIASFDEERIAACLTRLLSGRPIHATRYDPVTHAAHQDNSRIVMPTDFLIFEGLHAIDIAEQILSAPGCSSVNFTRIFVECADAERARRRLERELREATIAGSFSEFWRQVSQPVFFEEILPQRHRADIVISSPWPEDRILEIAKTIRTEPDSE
jgi:uridine kinase